ncbi:MAG: cytochrome d ubiquinol oxidase subunit II [Bacteroidales bacterium]|nr:cytochrome d ubiquinol oxidase subunit II [Bacteroidales bacterium]
MFGNLSHLALQEYWWAIISLLGGILVFMFFVLGGQTLLHRIGKTDTEVKMLVNSLGRKWDITFTTLVTFGGAAFASFPLFYSTSFGGAYWVWIIILFAFILQAVSYEYRSKANNLLGTKTFDIFLFLNGLVGTVFIGTAVATFFTGSLFSVNSMHHSFWQSPYGGLELALNFGRYATYINLSLGLAVFFLSRILASMYFMNNISDDTLFERNRKAILNNTIPFLVFFLFFLINILVINGFNYDPVTMAVNLEPFKYLQNLLAMPVVLILLLLGVVLVLWGIIRGVFFAKKCGKRAIWFTGTGTIITVFSLFLTVGYHHTAFYPSTYDLQSSLTIQNASSSKYTLTAMSYVSLMVPFVIAYIWYVWHAMNKKSITAKEMEEDPHAY